MPAPSAAPLRVVCALIGDGAGRVLVARRPEHKHLGGQWEFPGGKLERGEEPADALHREIGEELGCCLTDLRALPPVRHAYADGPVIELLPFACRLAPGSPAPQPVEHMELRWLEPAACAALPLAAADLPILAAYSAAASSSGR